MAVVATGRNQIRSQEFDFEGYAVIGGETIASATVWLQAVIVTNNGATDATLTITDNQGTPIGFYPNWIIGASATSSVPEGLFDATRAVKMTGGLKISASANNQLYVRGSYSR